MNKHHMNGSALSSMENNDYFKKNENIIRKNYLFYFFVFVLLLTISSSSAFAGDFVKGKVRFGVPPWPGLIVKTEIAIQILNTLGYKTQTLDLGTAFVLQGLANKDIDVFMGNWTPNQNGMVKKYLKKGSVKAITDNVDDASWGIGVPGYVWDAGVHSVEDLNKYRKKFKSTIYGIEKGSPMNKLIKKAINQNVADLEDWKLVTSSTATMLVAVQRAVKKHEWIAWGAWSPHWMMPAFHTKILINKTGTLLGNATVVRTLVSAGLRKEEPNVWLFFKQLHVSADTQSKWIYSYDREKKPLQEVARKWISGHRKMVLKWLDGVKSRDGRSAQDIFYKKYQ